MDKDDFELNGGQNLAQLLTGFPQQLRKRGRPSELAGSELLSIRDRYVQALENEWGTIGWDLFTAKSLADVRMAFAPINSQNSLYYRVDCFTRDPHNRAVEADDLRKLRRQLQENSGECRLAIDSETFCRERLERLAGALQQCSSPEQTEYVRGEQTIRQKLLDTARQNVEAARKTEDSIRRELESKEARFAQDEVLDFVCSGRYSFIPLNLANAIAGLPFMGWRQSMKRSLSEQCRVANSVAFRTFRLIDAAVRSCRSEHKELALGIRDWLQRSQKSSYELEQLRRNWYYLRQSIEFCLAQKHHPKATSFRVTAHYQKRISVRSNLDLLLEEEMQIK